MYQASVIIPTHNRPHFLREALQSVIAQEGVDLDIIVIGDGAGDDTAEVAAEFPSVRYVRQPQAGPNAARNHAVELSRFDNIALLDDDDLWLPAKMLTQLEILAKHPEAAYIFSDFHILREGQPLLPHGLSTWGIPDPAWSALFETPVAPIPDCGLVHPDGLSTDYHRADLYRPLLRHPYVLPTTAVFRKSFLTADIRFVDHDYICGDWEFFARLSRSHPALFMPVETACNRSHEEDGRLTRTSDLIQLQRRLEMLDRVWGADPDFLQDAVDRTTYMEMRHTYLLTLAKLHLRYGSCQAAMEAIGQAEKIRMDLPAMLRLVRSIATVPGGLTCLRSLDRVLLRLRSVLDGQ